MTPIESVSLRFKPTKDGKGFQDNYYVAVNGITDDDSFCLNSRIEKDNPTIAHFENDEVIKILISNSFLEVGKYFAEFDFEKHVEWWDDWIEIHIFSSKDCERSDFTIPSVKVFLCIEFESWSKIWSISEYAKELGNSVQMLNNSNISYVESDGEILSNGFGIEYIVPSVNNTIEVEIDKAIRALNALVFTTNKKLLAQINHDSIITAFQFPKEIQTVCNQYLIYFTQFMADIGIEVDTELKQEANQTLFKVTPENKSEALNQIQHALDIYLSAPNQKHFLTEATKHSDMAVTQWEANIYHLKAQLALAGSILQAKDATINALQLSDYQHRQYLQSKEVQSNNKEDLINGVLSITEYQGKGYSVNFAEILRRLKRRFK